MRFTMASRILNTAFLIPLTVLMVGCSKEKAATDVNPNEQALLEQPAPITYDQNQTNYLDPNVPSTTVNNTASNLVYDTYQGCADSGIMRHWGWEILLRAWSIYLQQRYTPFSNYQNPWNSFSYRMPFGNQMYNVQYNNFNNNYQAIGQASQCMNSMGDGLYDLSQLTSMGYMAPQMLLRFLIKFSKWVNGLGTPQYGWWGANNVGYQPPHY